MNEETSSPVPPHGFPPTRWSVVLAARQDTSTRSAAALEAICRIYWYPLYAYIRRCGQSQHDAQDLTQEFFSRLLEKRWLDSAAPEKGKLRTFLIVAVNRFMSNEWRKISAQKRGGNKVHFPMDTDFAESRYAEDSSWTLPAEGVFERHWALTLIDLTLRRLRDEFSRAGKAKDFDAMKECLMAEPGSISYRTVAAHLGLSEGAARVAVHRLRKRFREIYREEIAQTLPEGADLNEELHYLARALARE